VDIFQDRKPFYKERIMEVLKFHGLLVVAMVAITLMMAA
jgi:hypothetical protein